MELDTSFPTQLETLSAAPEPLRGAVQESLPSGDTIRLLVHAPSFPMEGEKSPATLLAVTNAGWLTASETNDGGAALIKAEFSNILMVELTSILLLGQLKISFAAAQQVNSVTIRFDMVGDEFYRQAIDLMFEGLDPRSGAAAGKEMVEPSILENWPTKLLNEAKRCEPRMQQLRTALHWPAVSDESQQTLAPAAGLLITDRELVLISEEKKETYPSAGESEQSSPESTPSYREVTAAETSSVPVAEEPATLPGDIYEYGVIITMVPRSRLADYQLTDHERFAVLSLKVQAAQASENLEIILPKENGKSVAQAIEQALLQSSADRD